MLERYAHRARRIFAFLVLLGLLGAKTRAFSAYPPVFSLSPAGVAQPSPTSVLLAASLINNSPLNAYKVTITSITLINGALTEPRSLPWSIGEIDAGKNYVLQTAFNSRKGLSFVPGSHPTLIVRGFYLQNQGLQPFTVIEGVWLPPADNGSATVSTGMAPSTTTTGGFPPIQEPQEFDEANPYGPPVPNGPNIPGTVSGVSGVAPFVLGDPPAIDFILNDPLDLVSGPFNGDASTTAEPSGASNGAGIIFTTANWTAAYSTNGGSSFTQLNPTTIFPNDAVGYCCDQVVQYVPTAGTGDSQVTIDRFIWLLQGNGYRIAAASPATVKSSGGKAWTYWNLTPAFFGLTGSLDYPDMSVGNNYLYLSFDEIGTGLMVARISLAQIAAGGTITVEWTNPANGGPAYGAHVSQDTGDSVFWAGQNTTSQMRIFSWAEGSGSYFWRDRNISSWSNTGLSSITPDGQDWLTKLAGFPGNAAIGATRAPGPSSSKGELSSDGIWFAWSAGTDNNFAQPHTEMVEFDINNDFAKVQQVQIWNSAYAFVYPALATNACTGEVGLSLEYGGNNTYYENHVVGFWGDYVVYITTNSNIGTTRFGDYVTIRQDYTPKLFGAYFDAFGYGLNQPPPGSTQVQTDARYVLFGRPGACSPQKIQ
jgi:hypothetical protein